MANDLIPGNGNAFPRRVVGDPGLWPELVYAYGTSHPKKILAEGDSWLAYPQILGTKNITLHLADNQKDYKDLILLSLARSGDEAVIHDEQPLQQKAIDGCADQL